MQRPISYKEAGVDMDQKDAFVERIKEMVKSTYGPEVVEGVGNFAALYEISEGRFLASGTDGVGTKLKVAQLLGIH
ncbi:MAG: phosphoribosylformylglycinamidine cyclo-ligase, partial [Planctomycetota bacterium]